MIDKHLTWFLFDKICNPSFIVDDHGEIVQINYSAKQLFLNFGSLKRITQIFNSENASKISNIISEAVSDKKTLKTESTILLGGLLRNVIVEFNPFFDKEDKLIFISLEFQDNEVQLRKSEKQLKELNAAKDRLFSIISHDLKSSFSLIMGMTQLLSSDIDDYSEDEVAGMAKVINESSERSYNLLINMLEWSRLQSGKLIFNPEYFKLKEVVLESVELQIINAFDKKIKLAIDINNDITVYADKKMIGTIIRNLLSNAYKFTRIKGKIEVKASYSDNDFEIRIKDNGIGIQADRLDTLFHLEHAVSESGTEDEKGTGLGLLLCKDLIDRHNGRINVISQIDKGSEFIVTIPNRN